jgi:hypothetical protein
MGIAEFILSRVEGLNPFYGEFFVETGEVTRPM